MLPQQVHVVRLAEQSSAPVLGNNSINLFAINLLCYNAQNVPSSSSAPVASPFNTLISLNSSIWGSTASAGQSKSPVCTTRAIAILPSHIDCQAQPSRWVCCCQYLQEWNKVVLFQVITARFGQEVHKFRSIIMTGLQSPGEEKREQMVVRLHPYVPSILLYHSFTGTSLNGFVSKGVYNAFWN